MSPFTREVPRDMRAEEVDPRVGDEWEIGPMSEYRVTFWNPDQHSRAYDLLEVQDVRDAIAWADEEAHSRGCTYALYVRAEHDGSPGLIWLAGEDPTAQAAKL